MDYPSDLRDREWHLIEEYFKQGRLFGRPLRHDRRSIVNAIFYITRSGCQWRMLPREYPPWQTVYYYFKAWCTTGMWEQVLDILNEKDRVRQGRKAKPSYTIIDSQSVKTQYKSEERGIDGGKKG